MEQSVQRISDRGNSGLLLKWIDCLSNPNAEPSTPAIEQSAHPSEEPVTSISITITLNDATKFPKTITVEKEKTVCSVLEEYLKVCLRRTTHA